MGENRTEDETGGARDDTGAASSDEGATRAHGLGPVWPADDLRRSPRYPGSRIWSRQERDQHRRQRDEIITDAGLEFEPPDP